MLADFLPTRPLIYTLIARKSRLQLLRSIEYSRPTGRNNALLDLLHQNGPCSTLDDRLNRRLRVLVPVIIKPGPLGKEVDVVGQVERHGDNDHAEEEEQEGIEDEFLGRCQHVERECDFILVSLPLQPSERRSKHGH